MALPLIALLIQAHERWDPGSVFHLHAGIVQGGRSWSATPSCRSARAHVLICITLCFCAASAAAGSDGVPPNVAEARAWIAAWKAKQAK